MNNSFLVTGIVGLLVGVWYLLTHNPITLYTVLWAVFWGIIAWIGFIAILEIVFLILLYLFARW